MRSALILLALALPCGYVYAEPPFQWKYYKVEKKESLKVLANTLQTKPSDLKKWNNLKGDFVKSGTKLRYKEFRQEPQSVGSPSKGSLIGGVRMPYDGAGYKINRERDKIWATPETIKHVKKCMAKYRQRFPLKGKNHGPTITIGDLSLENGGPAPPHVSHQSGRDVDIGYITIPPQTPGLFDREADGSNLDKEKQWFVVKCFLDNKDTQMIIMDWSVFYALESYIKQLVKNKKTKLDKKYLGYFTNPTNKTRIIGDNEHKTHMHVRFRCPKNDRRCID